MDKYRKFTTEMTAAVIEINRQSGEAKDGMVPINGKLFNEIVRLVQGARSSFNHEMEFKTVQAERALQKRFNLTEEQFETPPPKPKAKPKTPSTTKAA